MRLDPKVLKNIHQGQLIQASKLMEIKNAEKVSKENLTKAFIKKVEDVPEDKQADLPEEVINLYNSIVTELEKAESSKEPEEEKGGEEEEKEEKKEEKKEKGGGKKMKKGNGKKAVKKSEKKAAPKKEKKEKYTGVNAVSDAIKKFKNGFTMEKLLETANELYSAKSGKEGYEKLDRRYLLAIPVMLELGIAKQEGDKITIG